MAISSNTHVMMQCVSKDFDLFNNWGPVGAAQRLVYTASLEGIILGADQLRDILSSYFCTRQCTGIHWYRDSDPLKYSNPINTLVQG